MNARLVRPRSQASGDEGAASLALPLLLWVATLVAIVAIDLGAYLVAASRAQTLADHAALAAVSANVDPSGDVPSVEAAAVVVRGGGQLESCACPPGADRARVTVSVDVPGLVVDELGASRVRAHGSAVLTRSEASWQAPAPPEGSPQGSATVTTTPWSRPSLR